SARSRKIGMPSSRLSVRMSREVSRRKRRRGRRPPDRGGVVRGAAGSTWVAGIVTTILSIRREDGLLLRLDVLGDGVDVLGVVEIRLDRRDHDGRREVGPGIAVHELRNVLCAGDEIDGLLLPYVVSAGVGLAVAGDVVDVGLEVG